MPCSTHALRCGLTVLTVALLGGCTSPAEGLADDWALVTGTAWQVTELDGTAPLAGSALTLEIAPPEGDQPARAAGQAVNRFSSACTRNGAELSFGPVAATRMFRDDPPGAMEQEQLFFGLLDRVTRWHLYDDGGLSLILRADDGTKIVLSPSGAS